MFVFLKYPLFYNKIILMLYTILNSVLNGINIFLMWATREPRWETVEIRGKLYLLDHGRMEMWPAK